MIYIILNDFFSYCGRLFMQCLQLYKSFCTLLILTQRRTCDHQNLILGTPSGQNYFLIFTYFLTILNQFCPRVVSNSLKLLQMFNYYLCNPELMILSKLIYFKKILRKIFRFFDPVGIFKGLKSHVPHFSTIFPFTKMIAK